jgi:hypothetical protein
MDDPPESLFEEYGESDSSWTDEHIDEFIYMIQYGDAEQQEFGQRFIEKLKETELCRSQQP